MAFCMKTTLNLDDRLLRQAKKRAAATDRTLTAMIESGLRLVLAAETGPTRGYKFQGKAVKGAPLPGVDLNDRDALYERMDGRG